MSLLFRRDCVKCDTPTCPSCPQGQECIYTTQTCTECAEAICQAIPGSGSPQPTVAPSSPSHSNAGAIAGGVVGGVVVLALVTGFLLWKYYYSPRKGQQLKDDITPVDAEPGYFEKDKRHTVASLASVNTNMTRQSNVIPIAYIPGLQSRESEIPAMPDVPITMYGEQFFSAEDLMRNSHLSRMSQMTDSPGIRSSIATTNYRGSTVVIDESMMTAVNVKPSLVNVGKVGQAMPVSLTNGPVQIGQARPIGSQRANAHSIRIGKNGPIGLQNDMIKEEESGSDSDGEAADEKKSESQSQSPPPPPVPPIPTIVNATPGNVDSVVSTSSSERLRFSTTSGFDVPFMIDNNNRASVAARSSVASFKSARSRPQSVKSTNTNRLSRQASLNSASKRNTQANGRESEYVMDDVPMEAFLYAQQQHHDQHNEDDNETGRNSPFDDKYQVDE